ncbi:O-antigen translocase [Flavobacterium sp. '19STA2R22 D10 B1']|uniref:O-antigen translocase n=1 Tax=Flavobacterium aerium TaxID=3037261 RepID=UPI00278C5D6C|nr:O-antigen translocase [Flavobacterium sp. '19STA2R22 D10 B1']
MQTPLFKITSLNSLSVVIRIAIGLVTSKVVAFFIGPNGMALMGNMRNFLASMETISTLGFQNGIVKYVAENEKKQTELKAIISTVFWSLLVVTLLLSSGLFFFADFWNKEVFGLRYNYGIIFKALAIALPFYAFNVFIIAIINGLSQFKKVIYINIFGNIFGFIMSVLFIYQYKIEGALFAIVVTPGLMLFVSFFMINKDFKLREYVTWNAFDFAIIKNLSSYSLMAFVSAFIGPLLFLVIRNNVIDRIGVSEAGYWEAISRIATYYMMFISTILTVYFFPKLAQAKNNVETQSVFVNYYKTIMPLLLLGMIGLFLFRSWIVKILFTTEFLPVIHLFFWQLLGDFFKAASLILGYQFFAKKMTTAFIITEVGSLAVLYISSNYLLNYYQLEGIVMAHAFTYVLYFIVLVTYFRKSLFLKKSTEPTSK